MRLCVNCVSSTIFYICNDGLNLSEIDLTDKDDNIILCELFRMNVIHSFRFLFNMFYEYLKYTSILHFCGVFKVLCRKMMSWILFKRKFYVIILTSIFHLVIYFLNVYQCINL